MHRFEYRPSNIDINFSKLPFKNRAVWCFKILFGFDVNIKIKVKSDSEVIMDDS